MGKGSIVRTLRLSAYAVEGLALLAKAHELTASQMVEALIARELEAHPPAPPEPRAQDWRRNPRTGLVHCVGTNPAKSFCGKPLPANWHRVEQLPPGCRPCFECWEQLLVVNGETPTIRP